MASRGYTFQFIQVGQKGSILDDTGPGRVLIVADAGMTPAQVAAQFTPEALRGLASMRDWPMVADYPADVLFDAITSGGDIQLFRDQNGGWRDMIGQIHARATGPGNPSWSQLGATAFYAYKFAINDAIWIPYHLQHDYSPGTDIFIHAHWLAGGTDTATVKWEFVYAYAKGHNQASFPVASPTTVSVTQAAQGTAYRHMIAEIATGIASADFEVDGILWVRYKRVTNGGVDNANDIFLLTGDCHYQADRFATKNKAPDFYA